jgi:hypothetical protein
MGWKRFLSDLSKAMIMTDPIAYGWYMAWTLEARGRSQAERSPGRAQRPTPDNLGLARRPAQS